MLLVVAEYVERNGRDCPQRALAVELLDEAANLAVESLYPAGACS
jgi:hypothetical protein